GDLAAHYHALSRRDGGDRPELPELLDLLGGMPFQIPMSRVHRLPDAVQVGLAADARRTLALLSGRGRREARGEGGETAQHGKWKWMAHALYYFSQRFGAGG